MRTDSDSAFEPRTSVCINISMLHTVLPSVDSPEGQRSSDSGVGTGVIAGAVATGLVTTAVLIVVGVICAVKIRTRSRTKSVKIESIGFGK